jgi:hypothetical protein
MDAMLFLDHTCSQQQNRALCATQNFKVGHGCYSPRRALHATKPYNFNYKHPCEPYPVALKEAMPPFDLRWRGRLHNKVSYLTHMAAWGTGFTVEPDLFMIHLPHGKARTLLTLGDRAVDRRAWTDYYALPVVLGRVHLGDIRRQPEFRREVPLRVPAVSPTQVRAALAADRAEAARDRGAAKRDGRGGGGGGSRRASLETARSRSTPRGAALSTVPQAPSAGRQGQRVADLAEAARDRGAAKQGRQGQRGAPAGSAPPELGVLPLQLFVVCLVPTLFVLFVVPAWLWRTRASPHASLRVPAK